MTGILSDDNIQEELKKGRLIKYGIPENVEACSYDLRVGTIFREGERIKGEHGQVVLEPGDIFSLFTLEELDLPDDIAATVFPINSMSSQGLLVLNPGHIDPGFQGPLTVRAINLRYTKKTIDIGTPVFTVIFERLPKPVGKSYNKRHSTIPREKRELAFNSTDVEQNPRSMARLVMLGEDRPLMTGDEVDRRIREHWSTKATLIGTLIGVFLAGVAALFAIIGVYKVEPAGKAQTNSPSPTALSSPSPVETGIQNINGAQAGNKIAVAPPKRLHKKHKKHKRPTR